jgi:signal peptidase I
MKVSLFKRFSVFHASMKPALRVSDRLLAVSSGLSGIKRFDVVLYRDRFDAFTVKRVIGLPGEQLAIRDGRIFINNTPADDCPVRHAIDSFGPVSIPAGFYFLLGDNSSESEDSRQIGPVPAGDIQFKALAIYKPLKRFKILWP